MFRSAHGPQLEKPSQVPHDLGQFDARFQDASLIGRGGMAAVYAVLDTQRTERVALKRLLPQSDERKRDRNRELFEREFHTLAQLAHPDIVQVYDFGIDAAGPYYTMQLLDGGDLHEQAPLPWRELCVIARDVCSALSLLHSRRLVHRDISPRNVRRVRGGPAKLVDFGALSSMGASKLIVGTPPCCAPEVVNLQQLDARTDLFSLGATMYFALVGQHAYASHTFAGLPAAWQAGFAAPVSLVPDVPLALDALVRELLQPEPDARPASAAEVMQRLAAIEGLQITEEAQVAQAYLATPSLVGRERELAKVARRVARIGSGRGASVVVSGVSGAGLTRFLDACVLDAMLRAVLVARADTDDALSGELGVARALARQLIQRLPESAQRALHARALDPRARTLENALLAANDAPLPAAVQLGDSTDAVQRSQWLKAFQQFFQAVAEQTPFVLAVDDVDRIDEPSAALLAMVASECADRRMCLIMTSVTDAVLEAPAAHKLLLGESTRLTLPAFTLEQSQELLRSLFGDVPRLEWLAHRAHTLCAGNPRDLMRFAAHLVENGLVRYEAGAWSLPARIEQLELPGSVGQALQARITGLSRHAQELVLCLALCHDIRFTFAQSVMLSGHRTAAELLPDLGELARIELVRALEDDWVVLAHPASIPQLRAMISAAQAVELHARIARVLATRPDEEFRTARHLFRAQQPAAALDVLVPFVQRALEQSWGASQSWWTFAALAAMSDWRETYDEALRQCDALQRPARDKLLLLQRLSALYALFGLHDTQHLPVLLALLMRASGLTDYLEGDAALEPTQRLMAALQRAVARHAQTPEHDRLLDPVAAIRQLGRGVLSALAGISPTLDLPFLRAMPDLTPLAALSPALRVIAQLWEGMLARFTGRYERARSLYALVLESISAPDRAGLEQVQAQYLRLGVVYALGMLDASRGRATCLRWAEELEVNPLYESSALVVRMLHALFQADADAAHSSRRRIEHVSIQNSGRQFAAGGHLVWEIGAYALADDATGLGHAVEEIAALAAEHAGWQPVLQYARAERKRMRRASEVALSEIDATLASVEPGEHLIWAPLACAQIQVLIDLQRYTEARAAAERHALSASTALGEVPLRLTVLSGLALAYCGKVKGAVLLDEVIADLRANGIAGLWLGYAHELRALAALALNNRPAYQQHLEACRELYRAHASPALAAKHQRLVHAGSTQELRAEARVDAGAAGTSAIASALQLCPNADTRSRLALTLIARHSNSQHGYLFGLTHRQGAQCVAQVGDVTQAPELTALAREYMQSQLRALDTTCTESADTANDAFTWHDAQGRAFRPVLLSHSEQGEMVITGLAVLAVPPQGLTHPAQLIREISRHFATIGSGVMLAASE